MVEYTTDPELIHERYGREVALVIDGGTGDNVPTTVVDLTDGEPEILREGKGELITRSSSDRNKYLIDQTLN